MKMKSTVCVMGSLGLLFGIGSARADDQAVPAPTEASPGEMAQPAPLPECRDLGITVSFTTDSYDLDTNARGGLDGVVTWLKANEARTLNLHGFADITGSTEPNLVLSQHRADAVKAYLVAHGVDSTRIKPIGFGEIADHLPADGRTVTFLGCVTPPPPPVAEVTPPPAPIEPMPSAEPESTYGPYGSRFGWAFMAGGGYQDFTNSAMRAQTNAGGGWDLRLIGGTKSIIGFEAAYVGSARTIQTLGFTANTPSLVSNGVEGNLRINAPIVRGYSLFEPYAFAGVGWSHYSISNFNSNTQLTSDFSATDDVMTVPLGGGFAYGYKGFIMDVRGNYTPTYYNNLLTAGTSTGTLNTWGIGGQVGFGF